MAFLKHRSSETQRFFLRNNLVFRKEMRNFAECRTKRHEVMMHQVNIDIPQNLYEKSLGITGGSQEKLPELFLHLIIKGVEQEERKINLSEDVAWFRNHPVKLTEEDIDDRAKYILER